MAALTPLIRRRGRPGCSLAKHTVGNALVVCPENQMTSEAQALAMSVAPDAEHEMVVVDMPTGLPVSAWDSVAELLPRRRRGVRLILGGRSREATALVGQWLSERIGRTVVAPDGTIFCGAGGTLFVHAGKGSGWVRFRRGRAPEWESKRFPPPSWDSGVTDPVPTSSVGVADPIPGGVWIHAPAREPEVGGYWSQLVSGMPCQPEVLTVVLGCPGTPPLSLDDVSRFWRQLDDELRPKVRFLQYGPVRVPQGDTLGQALADLLGTQASCYTGVPVGSTTDPDIYTVCADGGLGWQSFAREVGYLPRTDPAFQETPALLTHRVPVKGLEQVAPEVYWYTPDAVLEVVQSGLWVRPPQDPTNAAAVRAEPWNADVNILAFDATDEKRAERMRLLAQDVLARLDPATRVRCLLRAAVPAAARPAEGEPVVEGTRSVVDESSVTDTMRLAVGDTLRTAVAEPAAGAVSIEAPVDPGISPAAGTLDSPGTGSVEACAEPEPPSDTRPARAMAIQLESSPVPTVDELPAPPPADTATADPAVPPAREPAAPTAIAAPELAPLTEPAPVEAGNADKSRVEVPKKPAEPRLQPIPEPAASALVAGHDLTEERAWLRNALSRDFDAMAHSISRILSEHPGFQGSDSRSSADVLTDTVAVRLHLSGRGEAVEQALRTGSNGPHVPFARCVVSGLTRLPSHRGATMFTASPTPQQWQLYQQRRLVTEWGFIHALTEPSADQHGEADVLVWSMTARRTKLLESSGADHVDNRVVFVPGTSFRILEMAEPESGGARGRILLRELAESEVDETGRVDARVALDELALTSLRRCVERWTGAPPRGAVGGSAACRFGVMPGLV